MNGKQIFRLSLLSLTVLVFAACNSQTRPTSTVAKFPIKGLITLNGKVPEYAVTVMLYPVAQKGDKKVLGLRLLSDKTGTFKGEAPAGNYKVTFKLLAKQKTFKKDVSGYDVFKNKYSDKNESPYSTEVKEVTGEDVNDLGKFDLEGSLTINEKKYVLRKISE